MSNHNSSGGVSRGVALVGMVITFLGGFLIGSISGDWTKTDLAEATKVERTHVPLGTSPSKGAEDARVTIVEFADFQCGYCSRSVSTSDQILSDFPGKVRWVFKHYPMPFHRRAPLASQASMAANKEGRFWEYHDMLFANRKKLGDEDLLSYARRTGLDLKKYKEAMITKLYEDDITRDMTLGKKLKVRGTPTFFINGRKHVGSMSYTNLRRIIKQELLYTQHLVDQGTALKDLYEKVSKKEDSGEDHKDHTHKPLPPEPAAKPAAKPQAARQPATEGAIYQIRPGTSPAWGKATAYSTVIMFGDYRCKNTAQVYWSLKELGKLFSGERLRVVFKQFPLHPEVKIAARAALAAFDQGKFWPYHEQLLRHSEDLSRSRLLKTARELKLDLNRFISDLDSDRFVARVEADRQEGIKFGTVDTPSLYINGKYLRSVGATDKLRDLIAQELQRATRAIRSGVERQKLYEHLISTGRKSV